MTPDRVFSLKGAGVVTIDRSSKNMLKVRRCNGLENVISHFMYNDKNEEKGFSSKIDRSKYPIVQTTQQLI